MKVILVKILQNFVVETDLKIENLRVKMELTMKFENGWKIKIRKRN
jgi:hypothetical protein